MSRPVPPLPAHAEHDPLLVAQAAAGDSLDPARAEEAQRWLATCLLCVRLASDLRAVSAAVAREPVPPRRRDFRLTPEQAAELQGNAFTRFLRGLTLPRARAFAPTAAGVMSIGLVFMVAGYAWPDDGAAPSGTESIVVPAAVEDAPVAGATPLVEPPPSPLLAFEEDGALELLATDEAEFYADRSEFAEGLSEHQSGSSARSKAMEASLEGESVETTDLAGRAAPAPAVGADLENAVGASAEEPALQRETQADDAVAETVPGTDAAKTVDAISDVVAGEAAAASTTAPGEADLLAEDQGLEHWIILVGAAIALVGGLLLLLGWLSRRATDPLLR